ncbi:MAG TPA: HAMP domain-containing sensor histidine kinase [Micromonosporaceae bacterium]|jgi:signal transduction histidine kinase
MRARILALVATTSSLVLVAFLIPLAILVRSSTADRALGVAVVQAQALAPLVATDSGRQLADAVDEVNRTSPHAITVFLPDGSKVGAPAPESAAVVAGRAGQSLTARAVGGREVIVAVEGLPGGPAVIRSFVPDSELAAGVGRAWLVLALLGLGLLVVSLVVADALARLLTRSLADVAEVAVRLADGALGARAADYGPAEVRRVSSGLNRLARRITELLAQERSTAADLSHRLRTPLTVLRIDLDAVADGATRARLVTDLDNVDHMLDDIIRDTERPARPASTASCDAAAVVRDRVRFWSVVAREEQRPTMLAIEPPQAPIPVAVSADDLVACLDALIGNVFAHTATGTAFALRLAATAHGGAVLVVSDEGTGMPQGPVGRRGESAAGSTGLGLDIVARTAHRSGGSLHIGQSPTGGAAVSVTFGPPEQPTIRSHRRASPAPGSGRVVQGKVG